MSSDSAPAEGWKDDGGKVRMGLLADFGNALREVARVSQYGIEKYGSRDGWKRVPRARDRYTDALWRHLTVSGANEEDGGLLHEAQAAWNALALLELAVCERNGGGGGHT